MIEALKKLDLWDAEMLDDLKYYDGVLTEIERIPEDVKEVFRTAFEIEPRWLIECASRRQKWIDMGQSLNLYLAAPNGKKLSDMYMLAWRKGLKTTYYLRTLAATQIEKSTVDVNRRGAQPRWMKNKSASANVKVDRQSASPSQPAPAPVRADRRAGGGHRRCLTRRRVARRNRRAGVRKNVQPARSDLRGLPVNSSDSVDLPVSQPHPFPRTTPGSHIASWPRKPLPPRSPRRSPPKALRLQGRARQENSLVKKAAAKVLPSKSPVAKKTGLKKVAAKVLPAKAKTGRAQTQGRGKAVGKKVVAKTKAVARRK